MHRIIYALFLFFFLTIEISFCQDPALWVSTFKSEGYDDCHDLYADQQGNIFVTGQIEFDCSFDGYNLSSYGSHDIFVARYDSMGNLIWAKHAGGPDGDIGLAIAVDNDKNVFITGEFESTSNFSGISKTAQGSNNMFVAKYNSAGVIQWVKGIGTNSGSTKGYGIACDVNGNVYACGTTRAKAYYNGSTLFTSRGSEDIILIKFDPSGSYEWHKQIGGSDSDEGFALASHGGHVYITGSFEGTCRFTSSVSLNDIGDKDFFLAKYDTSGNFIWAKKGGSSGDDIGYDVTINSNGNIICTGEFRGNATFGNNQVSSSGGGDAFVAAYDDSGNNLWVRSGGGNAWDFGERISNDNNGNVYVGGTYIDEADFDTSNINSNGDEDVFLASYDSSGNFRYVRSFGGPGHDRGHGTGADRYGNVYFSGELWEEIEFDSIAIDGDELYDGFIVRFGNFPFCAASSIITNEISCFGRCDGAIEVTPVGIPPFTYQWQNLSNQHTSQLFQLCAGDYYVTVTDSIGCVTNATVNVAQPDQIEISSAVLNTSCAGCSDGSILLSAFGGVPPYSYIWADGPVTKDRFNLPQGIYNVCVTDAEGCESCESFNLQTIFTSINESNTETIRVFPNPAVNFITVQLDDFIYHNEIKIKLHDCLGKLVEIFEARTREVRINLSDYSAGIYFMKIVNDDTGENLEMVPVIINNDF